MLEKSILIAVSWVSFGVLLGRISGFLREVAIANLFGVSSSADILIFALTIPNLLVNMLVAGGLSAALIPVFKRHSNEDAANVFFQFTLLFGAVCISVTFILVIFSDFIVNMLAPGFASNLQVEASLLLKTVLWLVPLTCFAGITTAYLQSMDKFTVPALGALIFNTCILIGLYCFHKLNPGTLMVVIWFVLLGGFVRWFSQLACLGRQLHGIKFRHAWLLTRDLFDRYYQAVIAIGVLSAYPVIVRSLATFEGPGSLASTNYALKLVELPLGTVVTVLAVVLYPRLSASFVENRMDRFLAMLRAGLLCSVVLGITIAIAMYTSAQSIVNLVYGWGKISVEESRVIAELFVIYSLSLPLQGVIVMLTSAFNAQKNTKEPMILSLLGLAFLAFFSWLGSSLFGLTGLATALVLTYLSIAGFFYIRFLGSNRPVVSEAQFSFKIILIPIVLASVISVSASPILIFANFSDLLTILISLVIATASIVATALISYRMKYY